MPDPTIVHNTFVVEKHYPVSAERLFVAFTDPVKKRRWYVEGPNKIVDAYNLDFRAGGNELVRYRYTGETPFPDTTFTNSVNYQVIVPEKRVVFANTMAMGDHIFSAALVSFELIPTDTGTDVICTHQGAFFENADGPKMREEGWRHLLDRLGTELTQG